MYLLIAKLQMVDQTHKPDKTNTRTFWTNLVWLGVYFIQLVSLYHIV